MKVPKSRVTFISTPTQIDKPKVVPLGTPVKAIGRAVESLIVEKPGVEIAVRAVKEKAANNTGLYFISEETRGKKKECSTKRKSAKVRGVGNPFARTKIGITTRGPEARMRQLQTGNSRTLMKRIFIQCKNPRELEGFLHDTFKSSRIRGEWFSNVNLPKALRLARKFLADEN